MATLVKLVAEKHRAFCTRYGRRHFDRKLPASRLLVFNFRSSFVCVHGGIVQSCQIPASPEQSAALAQLDRDCGSDPDNLTAFDFEVREAAAVETGNACTGCFEFGVAPFFTPCGPLRALGPESGQLDFSVRAPTTSKNLYRVLRALQVRLARSRDCPDFVKCVDSVLCSR